MSAKRHRGSVSARGPIWYADAHERLRALLPELAVCIVTTTCMSTVFCYHDGDTAAALIPRIAAVQIVVQTILYLCTYLVSDERAYLVPYVLVAMSVPTCTFMSMVVGVEPSMDRSMVLSISLIVGTILFYLTRPRLGLIALFVEILAMASFLSEITEAWMWVTHMVGFVALLALMVMRCSATRITRDYVADEGWVGTDGEDGGRAPALGLYAQVALVGIAIGALCLTMALASLLLTTRGMGMGTATQVPDEMSLEDLQVEGLADEGLSVEGQVGEGSSTAGHAQGEVSGDGDGRAAAGLLALVILLVLSVSPSLVRLLMRHLARRSIEREPGVADRAARLYVGIRDRLEAAGIERDEALTPREYLVLYEEELEELTAAAGIDGTAWDVITNAYEQARYAGLDPDGPALEVCWRAYDALPGCAREAVGWRRYLTGPFWRM